MIIPSPNNDTWLWLNVLLKFYGSSLTCQKPQGLLQQLGIASETTWTSVAVVEIQASSPATSNII